MGMDYSRINDWILGEDSFDADHLGKCEAVMCLGNGYLGLRSAAEESYLGETRDLLVCGTFNRPDPGAVTELANAADMTAVEIRLDGCRFSLELGRTEEYRRELNIRTGELSRRIVWVSPKGDRVRLTFKRVVSLTRLHDFVSRVEITPLSGDVRVSVKSGINGRVTASGSQHFTDGTKRFYGNQYMQYTARTTQSDITFAQSAVHRFEMNGEPVEVPAQIYMELRQIFAGYEVSVGQGETLTLEKSCNVFTTRDFDAQGESAQELQRRSLDDLKELASLGYAKTAAESAAAWAEQVWDRIPITIEGNDRDQFSLRFAQYHLRIMVPAHDSRMNIGGKGFSGEGYHGHCFWDTEIFLLPYYVFTQPETARRLEEYRYLSLPGAHRKAAQNGYEGAMFPWESSWLDDGETTSLYHGVDVVTGLPIKVWTGIIEQHVTADVAFGVWLYYSVTGDEDYMERYGYELIFDTAKFWVSRLEDKNRQIHDRVNPETGETEFTETVTEDGLYHICDIIGPDEYKEHRTDNAYTNYLAVWNMHLAMEYCDLLKAEKPALFAELNGKLGLDACMEEWRAKADRVFLPVPRADGVLPQDSTYLTLRDIDLSKYKEQDFVGGILRDYSMTQINQIQVSKQADVLVLFFLMENLFPREVKAATWAYYEARTIHDSSLSMCTHAVLAADMGEEELAYRLFRQSADIDLGPVMTTSDTGIHAASFGGVWQGAVYGFGGLRMLDGRLRIDPRLPRQWTKLSYTLIWRGQKLAVTVTREGTEVVNLTGTAPVELELCGRRTVV